MQLYTGMYGCTRMQKYPGMQKCTGMQKCAGMMFMNDDNEGFLVLNKLDTINHDPTGRKLREIIEHNKLSVAQVAVMIGIPPATLRNYTSGRIRTPYPIQFTVECLLSDRELKNE